MLLHKDTARKKMLQPLDTYILTPPPLLISESPLLNVVIVEEVLSYHHHVILLGGTRWEGFLEPENNAGP